MNNKKKVLATALALAMSIGTFAQALQLKLNNVTVKKAMTELKQKSGYSFVFEAGDVDTNKKVSVDATDLKQAIGQILERQSVSYEIKGKNIVISQKQSGKRVKDAKGLRRAFGTVKDAFGEPIIGATVKERGTSNGTVTDMDGNFSLAVAPEATLEISYIGYETQNLKSTDKLVDITMREDKEVLEEVVVVGYGTMKKSDLTGTTANIKSSDLNVNVTGNALESLQGKAPGVAVFNNNKPGEKPNIRVRGSGSISASNEPLYVVDGFPLMDGDISDINPADIESMEILKDASSTAIYGSRGANGVVMITTKTGKSGSKNLIVNTSVGVQMPGRLMNIVRGQDFVDYINAAYANAGSTSPFATSKPARTDVNWEKELLKSSALIQNYNLTFDGSNNGTSYMLSGGYYNQDGLVPTQDYEKFTFHTNLSHKFNSWLNVGVSLQYTYAIRNDQDNALKDVPRYGWATDSPYDEDGNPVIVSNPLVSEAWNPLIDFPNTTDRVTTNRIIVNAFAEAQIVKNLKYKLSIGQDVRNTRDYVFETSQVPLIVSANGKGKGSNDMNQRRSKVMENILTYSNEWDKHRFTATGVYSWQDYVYENIGASGTGFEMDQTGAWDMDLADRGSLDVYSTKNSNKLISYTGRVTYAYADRYLLTATARWDGSSRFGKDRKYGFFPSVGLGWRLSEEAFLRDNKVLTNLKLRGSFGITGNQEIGNYNSLPRLTASNYTDGKTSVVKGFRETIGNASLQWEKTNQWNFGVDLGLFDRININFDYYIRDTKDLLYNVPIPSTSGYSSILSNVGEVGNHGWELTIGGTVFKNQDWTVDASVNATYNKNEIKKLYGDVDRVLVGNNGNTGLNRELRVGQPVDGVYARHSLGIIKTEEQLAAYKEAVPSTAANAKLGDEMYEDINGDRKITADDYVCIGSVQPKYFYGLSLNVGYKDLTLNIYGQGGFKYASIMGAESFYVNGSAWTIGTSDTMGYLMAGENQLQNNLYFPTQYAYEHMWSPANPNGTFPAAGAHDIWLSDRSNGDWNYFILKNIQLTYNMAKLIGIKTVKRVDVSLNFQNFVTFANHRGYNPVSGDVSNPWAKAVILGVNLKF